MVLYVEASRGNQGHASASGAMMVDMSHCPGAEMISRRMLRRIQRQPMIIYPIPGWPGFPRGWFPR